VDDHGYRLTIHDWKEVQIIQMLFEESHVEAVVCLSRSDSWGDGILVELSEKWEGELVNMSYGGAATSFLGELQWAEETVSSLIDGYGEDHVAVLALSFTEMATILNQSRVFPVLQRVQWYGPGFMKDDWPTEIGCIAASLNLTSFAPMMPESTALKELNSRYNDTFGEDIGYYEANLYDVCWILSLSVLEAGSDNASALRSVIPDIAAGYPGVTGNCTLDQYGDRNIALFGIYRYEVVDGELSWSLTDEYLIEFQEVFNREGVH
jgi:branched-chain amino acid transport system substrate-binding protein